MGIALCPHIQRASLNCHACIIFPSPISNVVIDHHVGITYKLFIDSSQNF